MARRESINARYRKKPGSNLIVSLITFDIRSRILTFFFNVYARVTAFLVPRKGVQLTTVPLALGDSSRTIKLDIIRAEKRNPGPTPCLVYAHGGGFAIRGAGHHRQLLFQYARQSGYTILAPDYDLLPKHPFPAALDQYIDAIAYAWHNAEELGIDRDKIVLGGDSAGGCLAAAAAQSLRDREEIPGLCLRGQLLIYPALDHRVDSPSSKEFTTTPVWNSTLSLYMWKNYLRDIGAAPVDNRMSPALGPFKNLPPAYIETAEYDALRDEGIAYAKACLEAGVQTTIHQTAGTLHAYDLIKKSSVTRESISKRVDFLKNIAR